MEEIEKKSLNHQHLVLWLFFTSQDLTQTVTKLSSGLLTVRSVKEQASSEPDVCLPFPLVDDILASILVMKKLKGKKKKKCELSLDILQQSRAAWVSSTHWPWLVELLELTRVDQYGPEDGWYLGTESGLTVLQGLEGWRKSNPWLLCVQ